MGPPSDVSDTTLAALGDSGAQEAHVRPCLENGGGGSLQSGRYLVYKLPDGSPSVAKECVICMEDFVVGATIVRLPCSVLLPPGLYRQLVQERPGLSSACADFVILVRSSKHLTLTMPTNSHSLLAALVRRDHRSALVFSQPSQFQATARHQRAWMMQV
ncbi:unnamed protein product [Tilletia caries]|nr:unnamed protein product [Tilletia caries]